MTMLPVKFWAGARIERGRTSGCLTIDRGELSLTLLALPWAAPRPPIVHTAAEVRVLRARLIPPWFNTHVLVESNRGTASVALPAWTRRKLIASLKAAGLVVREEKRWIAIGAMADWR